MTDFFQVLHSLRGCVRNLKLDGNEIDLPDLKEISGVEMCYATVEPGVGFNGLSSGVYGKLINELINEFTMTSLFIVEPVYYNIEGT